jgi:hypothetical protein
VRSSGQAKQPFGCELLMAVTMKSTVFWVVTPCSLETARRYGTRCRHHLHLTWSRPLSVSNRGYDLNCSRSLADNSFQAWTGLYQVGLFIRGWLSLPPASSCFLFGVLFDPEDKIRYMLPKQSGFFRTTTALQPRKPDTK